MIAGPGAAYICDDCLQLCNDILSDPTPFSTKALELASRPPVVVAASQRHEPAANVGATAPQPLRTINIELEQKQEAMTLILHRLVYYPDFFELHYLWIRPPFTAGFSFVPRIIFFAHDNTGTQWTGDRGGIILARPELASGPNNAVYQGTARFRPLPSSTATMLTVRATDPLGQFDDYPAHPWQFEITIS
jgi:hypothetical protein